MLSAGGTQVVMEGIYDEDVEPAATGTDTQHITMSGNGGEELDRIG